MCRKNIKKDKGILKKTDLPPVVLGDNLLETLALVKELKSHLRQL